MARETMLSEFTHAAACRFTVVDKEVDKYVSKESVVDGKRYVSVCTAVDIPGSCR